MEIQLSAHRLDHLPEVFLLGVVDGHDDRYEGLAHERRDVRADRLTVRVVQSVVVADPLTIGIRVLPFPALARLLDVVEERVHATGGDVRVPHQVPMSIEIRAGWPALGAAVQHVMQCRVHAGFGDIRVAAQVPLATEEARRCDGPNIAAPGPTSANASDELQAHRSQTWTMHTVGWTVLGLRRGIQRRQFYPVHQGHRGAIEVALGIGTMMERDRIQ